MVYYSIKKMIRTPTDHINSSDDSFNEFYLHDCWEKSENKELRCYEYCDSSSIVLGYITINMCKLYTEIGDKTTTFPAVLIGRLAANQNHKDKNIGNTLIKYVIALTDKLSNHIGCRLLMLEVLHIKDDYGNMVRNKKLIDWYISLGFEETSNEIHKNKTYLFFDLLN